MFAELETAIGTVQVMTTSGRGFSAEELAERALNQIINVGDNAPPVIADQAHAFRDNLREVLIYFMREAMRSGWNASSPVSFSPTPTNLIGRPVT